jgi:hypothetical protein
MSGVARKYDLLAHRLASSGADRLTLTLDELERIVGGLPASARAYPAWWANDRSHVQAVAWLDAGYRVDALALGERVTFAKARA